LGIEKDMTQKTHIYVTYLCQH